jgi:hypothetical protein
VNRRINPDLRAALEAAGLGELLWMPDHGPAWSPYASGLRAVVEVGGEDAWLAVVATLRPTGPSLGDSALHFEVEDGDRVPSLYYTVDALRAALAEHAAARAAEEAKARSAAFEAKRSADRAEIVALMFGAAVVPR